VIIRGMKNKTLKLFGPITLGLLVLFLTLPAVAGSDSIESLINQGKSNATDRQRDLLFIISQLDRCDDEFSVQEIVDKSKQELDKPFSNSMANQMCNSLINSGLLFKNRHGKYSFAIPLFGDFVKRQYSN